MIKRYNPDCSIHMNHEVAFMRELAGGEYVKYSDHQQLLDALAAENAALKAGATYFAYSPEYGFDYFKDKQSAIDTAQDEIDAYREDAFDGWSEDVRHVSWGIVIQQAQGFDAQGLHTSDSQHTYQTCDYRLADSVETPATDAAVAAIEARGVEKLAEWAGAQESMAADDGDKKEAAIYRQLEARARHYAAELRKHSQEVERG